MTDANERSGVEVEYDPGGDLYVGSFDDDTDASTAVVEAVAAVRYADPIELAPLYHSVDTDALDSLVTKAEGPSVAVSFEVDGQCVSVRGDGTIEIEPPELDGV